MKTPTITCLGCRYLFSVRYDSGWFASGAVAHWIECPRCKGKFVISYQHNNDEILSIEEMATSFTPPEKQYGN